jgi:transposase InsO family protein
LGLPPLGRQRAEYAVEHPQPAPTDRLRQPDQIIYRYASVTEPLNQLISTPTRELIGPEPKQYVSIRYTERLAEAGIEPSVGSVGDSYDCEFTVLLGEPGPSYD